MINTFVMQYLFRNVHNKVEDKLNLNNFTIYCNHVGTQFV